MLGSCPRDSGSNPDSAIQKIKERDVITILEITKQEANVLYKNGFEFHDDLFKTYSGHPTYYVKEHRRTRFEKEHGRPMTALEFLEDYKNKTGRK